MRGEWLEGHMAMKHFSSSQNLLSNYMRGSHAYNHELFLYISLLILMLM